MTSHDDGVISEGGAAGGVVLSAGRSERMGEPKALLDLDGRTFLEAAVSALLGGGCETVVVVAGGAAVAEAAGRLPVVVVRAGSPGAEQVDSLRAGLAALPADTRAAVVLPVDHPLVRPDTVRRLIEAGRDHPDAVIRPTLDQRPGHPTLFPRPLWERLHDPDLPRGARSVVESPDTPTVDVAVDDPGVLADIDTTADYRRHVGGGS